MGIPAASTLKAPQLLCALPSISVPAKTIFLFKIIFLFRTTFLFKTTHIWGFQRLLLFGFIFQKRGQTPHRTRSCWFCLRFHNFRAEIPQEPPQERPKLSLSSPPPAVTARAPHHSQVLLNSASFWANSRCTRKHQSQEDAERFFSMPTARRHAGLRGDGEDESPKTLKCDLWYRTRNVSANKAAKVSAEMGGISGKQRPSCWNSAVTTQPILPQVGGVSSAWSCSLTSAGFENPRLALQGAELPPARAPALHGTGNATSPTLRGL